VVPHVFSNSFTRPYSLRPKLVVTVLVKFDLDTHVPRCVSTCWFANFGKKVAEINLERREYLVARIIKRRDTKKNIGIRFHAMLSP
jgi:coproporphyrinogen III oxidase-like Fe-S oxidoreductase